MAQEREEAKKLSETTKHLQSPPESKAQGDAAAKNEAGAASDNKDSHETR
jgi:hypothetical protein